MLINGGIDMLGQASKYNQQFNLPLLNQGSLILSFKLYLDLNNIVKAYIHREMRKSSSLKVDTTFCTTTDLSGGG